MYSDLYACMVLGFITLAISLIITISQFYIVTKTKNTSGISLLTYCIFMLAGWICLAWVITYYFKVFTSRPTIEYVGELHPDSPQPYGPYWLWQWGIMPLISYYIFDVLMGFVLMYIKIHHVYLAKKLNMSEINLANHLINDQKDKLAKSGNKLTKRKYFWFTIILIILFAAVITFTTLWAIYVKPQYNPKFYDHVEEWYYVWVLGLIGALTFEAISWPQFIKCIREKNTSGISLNWAIFLPIGMLISFSYALALALAPGGTKFPPDTIGALVFNGLIVNFAILVLKLKNIYQAKKHHMTEFEYTKKYLIPLANEKAKQRALKKAKKQKRA